MNHAVMLDDRTTVGLRIVGTGAVLGVAADLLLRATPWGLNALLCVAALVGACAWLARRSRAALTADAPWLAATALLIGSNFVARDSAALRLLDAAGLLIVFSLAPLTVQGAPLRRRSLWKYGGAALGSAVSACTGAIALVGRDIRWNEVPRSERLQHARSVGLGVAVALPLLVAFGGLFASADVVFGNVVANVVPLDVGQIASHVFLIGCCAALAAGYLRGALLGARAGPAAPAGPPLGIVPVATALALVDLLFLVFVVVQVRYFFGGAAFVERATGVTYAEYARRGFFELVAASGLVLPVLLGADCVLRGEPPAARRTFRQLAALLLVLLAVVMASAFERMRLYVEAFGLSEIRLYATAFMLYLLGTFVWFAWTVLRGRRRGFAFGAAVQGFVVLGGLHLLNPDAFIVRTNLARTGAVRPFDAAYASSLGADAVPALLATLPSLDSSQACRVAHRLLARWTAADAGGGGGGGGWRNWNWSRARARRLVRDRQAELRARACPQVTEQPR